MPRICDRCYCKTRIWTTSYFSIETICDLCSEEEKDSPNYQIAVHSELAATIQGDYNFPGIGLASEDILYLTNRRLKRVVPRQNKFKSFMQFLDS